MNPGFRKTLSILFLIAFLLLAARYLLPLLMPFLLGAGLAFAAEPMVRFFCTRLRIPRVIAAGIGVSMAFSFLALLVLMLCGLLIRELGALTQILPELESAVRTGMDSASGWLLSLAQKAPGGIQTLLTRNVNSLFTGGSALLDRLTDFLLRLASGILSQVPDSALSLGTGIIASFMFSAKLPKIRQAVRSYLPIEKIQPVLDSLNRMKAALFGWLKAQIKLSAVTCLILTIGFLVLRVRYAPLWAFATALVDAFPILGIGTVLIPWSLVSFLQGNHFLAFGLLVLYLLCALIRSVLEPRLVGKHLGLDPLVTLMALYAGYRLWGLLGMIFAPMLCVAVTQLLKSSPAARE